MVTWPPLTDVTTPAALTVAMYELLEDQATVVVAAPVTVAVSPWCRSGVSIVKDDSLSVSATGPRPLSLADPSSDVPVSAALSTSPSGTKPPSAPESFPAGRAGEDPHPAKKPIELVSAASRAARRKALVMAPCHAGSAPGRSR